MQLAQNGVTITREALARQVSTTGTGLAVDIQADAPHGSSRDADPARCGIELKGNWHPKLMTAMRTQLAEAYLIPEQLHDGIYLTA